MIKKFLGVLIILAVIGGGSVAAGWAYIGGAIRGGIEKGMSYALQVDVKIGGIQVHPLAGKFEVEDMVIGNPEGYETRSAFQIRRATVEADLKSFTTDEPTIHLIQIDQPRVTFERGLRNSNLKQLVANASRFSETKEGEQPAAAEESPSTSKKKLKIEKVVLDGTVVGLSAPILKGQEVDIPLTRIEMNNIGEEKERVGLAEFLRLTIEKILTTTLSEGKSVIPSGFTSFEQPVGEALNDVKSGLGGVTEGVKGIFGRK